MAEVINFRNRSLGANYAASNKINTAVAVSIIKLHSVQDNLSQHTAELQVTVLYISATQNVTDSSISASYNQ